MQLRIFFCALIILNFCSWMTTTYVFAMLFIHVCGVNSMIELHYFGHAAVKIDVASYVASYLSNN